MNPRDYGLGRVLRTVSFPVRPVLWRVLICLVLGGLLTLASAWLPAARSLAIGAPRNVSRPLNGERSVPYLAASLTEAACADWLLAMRVDHVTEFRDPRRVTSPVPSPPEEAFDGALMTCAWPALVRRFREGSPAIMLGAEATGWPMRVFWCEFELSRDGRNVSGAFEIAGLNPPRPPAGLTGPLTLPYRPIWSGLAIDLAFWSAAAAPLVFAPMAIRRLRRKQRGACAGCGYDRRGLPPGAPCPECGAADRA